MFTAENNTLEKNNNFGKPDQIQQVLEVLTTSF